MHRRIRTRHRFRVLRLRRIRTAALREDSGQRTERAGSQRLRRDLEEHRGVRQRRRHDRSGRVYRISRLRLHHRHPRDNDQSREDSGIHHAQHGDAQSLRNGRRGIETRRADRRDRQQARSHYRRRQDSETRRQLSDAFDGLSRDDNQQYRYNDR